MAKQEYLYIVNEQEYPLGKAYQISYHKSFNGAYALLRQAESYSLELLDRIKPNQEITYDAVHTKGVFDPSGVWSHTSIYRQGHSSPDMNGLVKSLFITRQPLNA